MCSCPKFVLKRAYYWNCSLECVELFGEVKISIYYAFPFTHHIPYPHRHSHTQSCAYTRTQWISICFLQFFFFSTCLFFTYSRCVSLTLSIVDTEPHIERSHQICDVCTQNIHIVQVIIMCFFVVVVVVVDASVSLSLWIRYFISCEY